jgi:aminoglycoside phosphotransferase (APT) family kinase protein
MAERTFAVTSAPRTEDQIVAGLTRWYAAREGGPVAVTVARPPAGLSSDTVLAEVSSDSGRTSIVVRFPPAGETNFPDYDLGKQYRVQQALSRTAVPVAPLIAYETDPSWLGAPFVVMSRVAGRTVTLRPSYALTPWLVEATREQQRAFVLDFVRHIAAVNRTDPGVVDAADLGGGGPTLAGMLDYWERYLHWAAPGSDGIRLYLDALGQLRKEMPDEPAPGLLWGDPQFGNAVFDERGEVVALLDWEMAAAGPAEVDLGWFIGLHDEVKLAHDLELPGYPSREEIAAAFEQALGRPITNLAWYELLAHVRSGATFQRIIATRTRAGLPVAESWQRESPQAKYVTRFLEGSRR